MVYQQFIIGLGTQIFSYPTLRVSFYSAKILWADVSKWGVLPITGEKKGVIYFGVSEKTVVIDPIRLIVCT